MYLNKWVQGSKTLVSHPKKEYNTLKWTQCLAYVTDILQYSKKVIGSLLHLCSEESICDLKKISICDLKKISICDLKKISVCDLKKLSICDLKKISICDLKKISICDLKKIS